MSISLFQDLARGKRSKTLDLMFQPVGLHCKGARLQGNPALQRLGPKRWKAFKGREDPKSPICRFGCHMIYEGTKVRAQALEGLQREGRSQISDMQIWLQYDL